MIAITIAFVGFVAILEVFPIGFAAAAKAESRSIAGGIAGDLLSRFRRELSNISELSDADINTWTNYPATNPRDFVPVSDGDPVGASGLPDS